MTAAEGSLLGMAIQGAEGTPEDRDAQFKYLLFSEGQVAANNINLPLDPEVGGGALVRNVVRVGVNSGGALALIPRPETLGMFLYGITGQVTSTRNHRHDAVDHDHALDGTTVLAAALDGQPSVPTKLTVQGNTGSTGTVTVTGAVGANPSDTEVLTCSGTTVVEGSKLFTSITSLAYSSDAGKTCSVGWYDGSYTHAFAMNPSDMFAAPAWTLRSQLSVAQADSWGEQLQDAKINLFSMEYKAPGFIRGAVSFIGGKPTPALDTSGWNGLTYVDTGPQFLTSIGSSSQIQVPTGTNLKVLGGSFAAASAIPLDESYIVGSFYPDALNIVSRNFGLNLIVKLEDQHLYHKMQYDPSEGNAWTADLMREAIITMNFYSDQDAATVKRASGETGDVRPYSLNIAGNGYSGDNANIVWTMAPIGLRAQRQIVAQLTGTFLASPQPAAAPITITLVNRRASYAYVTP